MCFASFGFGILLEVVRIKKMTANGINNEAPQWLTHKYLEKALQKYKKDITLRITDLEIRPAVSKGENYASVMTRVRIAFEYGKDIKIKQQDSYIVKSVHESDPDIKAIFKPYQVYKTEMDMYETVLPKLSLLLQEIGDKDKLFAETIYVDYDNEAIIFEDLAVFNFVTADRILGMNIDHAKLALRKLAKMHGTAAALNERTKGALEKFSRGIFNRHTRGFGPFYENMLLVCADFAADCPELGTYYKDKLLKLIPHVVEYATRATEIKEGQFLTLNHGDFWINNVMLRYNDEKLVGDIECLKIAKDIIMIDFQFCKWTSPVVDLHYFFNTSLESSLRLNGQEDLVQFYYKVLSQTLHELDYNGHIPSLHDFWVQIEDRRFVALTSALVAQPFMINENTEDADVQAFLFNDERSRNFRTMLYTNHVVQENVKILLPFFDRHGLLDVTD